MPTIADLQVKYSADTSGAEAGTNKVQSLIGNLTSGAKGLATVAGGLVLGTAITKLVGGVGQLATAGLDFEQQMANVNSVLQDDSAVKKYGDALIALSSDPRVLAGPAELASGFYNVASAGFTGQGALDVMTQAAYAATAGMTTADVAASAIAGTMNAYGQETYTAQQVTDALFGAVAAGSLTFEQLASNLGNTTSLASQMGVSINELASAYAVMSNNNISAAQAETQISALMRSAANPTADLTAAVQAHGYATAEAAIASEGFGGFLDMVTEAAGGSKEKLYDMLGTQEAVNAALILGADGGSEYQKVLKQIAAGTKGVGATQLALAKQMDSANYKIAEARKQVQIAATLFMGALAPAIGAAAAGFSTLVQGVTKFTQTFIAMMNPAANFSMWLQQFPGWAQPVIKLLAGMYQAVGDLVDAWQDFRRGDYAGALDELREAANTAWDAIAGLGAAAWDGLVGAFQSIDWSGVADTLVLVGANAIQGLYDGLVTAWPAVTDWASGVGASISSAVGTAHNWLTGKGKEMFDGFVSDITSAATAIKPQVESALSTLFDFDIGANFGNNLGQRFGEWLNGLDWGNLFGTALNIQTKLMQGIGAAALGALTLLGGFTGQMASAFTGFLTGMVGAINWGGIQSAIGDKFRQVFEAGSDRVQEAVQKISDYLGRELSRAADAVSSALGPAKTAIDDISTAAGNAVTLVKNLITEGFDKLQGVGDKVSGYLSPITTVLGDIEEKINAIIGAWNNLPFVGNSGGSGGRAGNEIAAPGSGYVSPPSAGGPVTNGVPITTLPNVGSGTTAGAGALAAQAKAAAQQVAAAMTQLAASVRSGVAQTTAALNPLGTAFTATGARVTAAATQMRAQVTANVTAMVAAARAQFTQLQSSTTASMTAMVVQVNAQFTQMTASGTAQVNALRAAVQAGMSSMAAAGSAAMSQFANAVRSGFSQAAAAAQSGVAAIRGAVNSIGSLYGQGFSIGSSFGQGVAAGLYSMLGAVQAAAAAIVAAAAQAAAAAGRISSPSKLMRDEIGVPLAQGVIVGLDSQRSNVASAFASMIPVDARLGRGYRGAGSSPYAARSSAGAPVVQNVTIYTLKADEYQRLLKQAQNGDRAYQQQLPRSRDRQLGSTR